MVNLLVRGVPDDVHAELQRRAELQGQSVQQYLMTELRRLVSRPTLEQVLARVENRSGGRVGLAQAAEDVRADRDR